MVPMQMAVDDDVDALGIDAVRGQIKSGSGS